MVNVLRLAIAGGAAAMSGAALFVALGGTEALRQAQIRRLLEESEVVEARTDLTPEEIKESIETAFGNETCQLLNREWNAARRDGKREEAQRFFDQATEAGCPWVEAVTSPVPPLSPFGV